MARLQFIIVVVIATLTVFSISKLTIALSKYLNSTRFNIDPKTNSNKSFRNHELEEILNELAAKYNMSESSSTYKILSILKDHNPPGAYDQKIQNETEENERCERYGLKYNSTVRNIRRRIFFGGMICDESLQVIATHAAEVYGLYHTVALIESNVTFMGTERNLKYTHGSIELKLLQSLFGPNTNVTVNRYIDDPGPGINQRIREQLQREEILNVWKENGMTENDVGLVGDVDEVLTRDFLLAAQICDVPEFRLGQDCRSPKVIANTLIFEASPECINENNRWYHPDMIIGECIDTIGSGKGRIPAVRNYKNGTLGTRIEGGGKEQKDYEKMPKMDLYPLWKPVDFRNVEGGQQYGEEIAGSRSKGHVAYHFHNYFDSLVEMRDKYEFYGHPVKDARKLPLGKIHPDINTALLCAMNRTLPEKAINRMRNKIAMKGGFLSFNGRVPLMYEYANYRNARHKEVQKDIKEDEAVHGIYEWDDIES